MTRAARFFAATRWLRWLLAAVGLVLLLGAGGVAWLVRSDGGSAWLLTLAPGVSASGTSGRLLDGPFAARRIEISLGPRRLTLHGLAWQDARWTWRPHDGAWLGLVLIAPRIERIDLGGAAATAAAPAAPESLRLPLALTLQDARIGALHIEGQAPLTQISASVELGARAGAEHRVSALAFVWDRARVNARASVASDAPFALELQTDAHSIEGSTLPWQASASARGPLTRFALQAQLDSAQAAGATLRADATVQPFAPWPLAALAATTQDLDLAALGSGLPATRLSGRVDFDTRGLDAPVGARLALTNALPGRWDQQRVPVVALDVELAGQPRDRSRLTVRRFALQLPEGAGRIEGSGEWRGTTAQLALRLQAVRPSLLDERAAAMTLSGSSSFDATGLPSLDGKSAAAPTQSLQARLALDGRLDARSALPVQISASATAERQSTSWRVDVSELQVRSGEARAQARLGATQQAGTWRVESHGELAAFNPALWFPGTRDGAWRQGSHRLAGRWRTTLEGGAALAAATTTEARLLALRGDAELTLQDSRLAGTPLQGKIKLDGRTPGWAVDADLRAGSNHATLQGRLAPRGGDDRWRIVLDAPALALLQPLLDLQPAAAAALRGGRGAAARPALSGQLGGELQTQGRWPASSIDANLRASGLQAPGVRAGRLQLKIRAGPDANAALALQLDAEQLGFGELQADTLQARVEGSLAEHRLSLDLQSPLRPPAWTDRVLGAKASGSRIVGAAKGRWLAANPRQGLLPGRWQGQAIELEARDRGASAAAAAAWLRIREVALQVQLDPSGRAQSASVEPGRVEALGVGLRWSEAQWRAGVGAAPAEARLEAQLEPLAVAPWLQKLWPAAGLGGNLVLAGRARLQAGERVVADVVVERASGDLTLTDDLGTQAFGLTDLRLAVAAQEGTWHFTQALAGRNLGVLAGAQSLRLAPQARWPRPDSPMQGVLEWQVADLGAWAPFTPPGWRITGAMRTSAALGGTFGAPEVTGELRGSRLAVRNLLQGVDMREGELALALRGTQATVNRFVFKGGSGELRLTGGASLGADPRARLQLEAERFQLLGRVDRRIVATGSATLVLSRQALDLDGRFRVDEGLIDFSRNDAPSLDSDVHVRGARHAVAAAQPAGASAPAAAPAPPAPADAAEPSRNGAPRGTRVALKVDLGRNLRVRGRGLDSHLRGDLAVTTPGGRLAVIGSVSTEAGTYAAYGQKLAIERGELHFSGPVESPRLDIIAVRPNLDIRVGVQVSGTAQSPRVRLFSEPEVSDTDKLSWLVLGRAPDGLARTDTALLQRAAMALLAGQGRGPDSALLSTIGLDEFSLRQTEAGEVRDTVVTLGKQLSRRWYVGYERGVNSTTGTWQLIYRVAQRITVRAQAGDDSALDAIWTWRWN